MPTSIIIIGTICLTVIVISLISTIGKRTNKPRLTVIPGTKKPPYNWANEED